MTPKEFEKTLSRWQTNLQQAIDRRIPHECGMRAIELFRENFNSESFFGKKWQRRRQDKNAPQQTKLLQRTGALADSMSITQEGGGKVTVTSDLPYSRIHNEGGTIRQTVTARQQRWMGANWKRSKKAGSEMAIKIPKRQFMGDSPKLREELKKTVTECVNNEVFK
jgi:phage gpG-like protein